MGLVNKAFTELMEMGLIGMNGKKEVQITKLGLEALTYRVKRAVIIAAGFGSRLVPITLNTPKPLVRVHGKMIVETLLDAIVQAGIPEIVLVRGYLWEQFDVLVHKYPGIRFLHNPIYNESNNISSLLRAKDYLENAYVCEADLLINNPRLLRKYEYHTNYLGQYPTTPTTGASRPRAASSPKPWGGRPGLLPDVRHLLLGREGRPAALEGYRAGLRIPRRQGEVLGCGGPQGLQEGLPHRG